MTPKVFISYSWSSQEHQMLVKSWAEQLMADGINVILDIFDLKEGHDKFAFMERMVTDPEVTHVLVFSDRQYAEKANARRAGVGTETQIISKNVYEKVDQSKFIPIICEFDATGKACLPTFFESRISIDFSSPEAANKNWEQLIRVIFGKPLHEKPDLGKPPSYITDESAAPASPVLSKYRALRQAILEGRPGVTIHRQDFIDACVKFADKLRVRERPQIDGLGHQIVDDFGKLKLVRTHLVDWVLLESSAVSGRQLTEALVSLMETLLDLKSRPAEITSWNESWFDAHKLFVYETFLYVVAALLKAGAMETLHELFTTHYIRPKNERSGDLPFVTFDAFFAHSDAIQTALAPEGRKYHSAAAELFHRHADREDLPFASLMEAELLTYLMALISPQGWWYPGTLHYSSYSREFPLFLRAAQHKYFAKLAIITGIESAEELRKAVRSAIDRSGHHTRFRFDRDLWTAMNMDHLNTIK